MPRPSTAQLLAPLLSTGLVVTLGACKATPAASESETSATVASASSGTASDSSSETEGGTDTETGTGTETEGGCSSETPAALMECVERPRYEQDLGFVADLRVPGSTHWQAVQDLCADRLSELGYEVELQDYGSGVNVLGVKPGTSNADERVIVGAHYDHIPNCTGADDNATGVAAVLEVARVLAEVPTPRTLVITCWDEEELGLVGSEAQAQIALDAGEVITAAFSYDMVGYVDASEGAQDVPGGFDLAFPDLYSELEENGFRGDFLFWVSDEAMAPIAAELEGFAAMIALPTLGASLEDAVKNSPIVADLRRSDHASFWEVDVPAMMLNDTGEFRYASYHCGDGNDDSLDRLDNAFAVKVTQASTAAVAVALGLE